MRVIRRLGIVFFVFNLFLTHAVFADLPSTSTYKLNSYGFGSGGTANSSTSNYSLEGITGEVSGQTASTANYSTKPGFVETQQANVPKVTITNPSNYYDKLKFVIDEQSNPTDAKYALQIKSGDPTCNFATGTLKYCLRAKATQGNFTESGYGPSTSAATVGQQISFCTYSTSGSCGGSNSVTFGALTGSNITNSTTNIGVDFATNANSGGNVYVYSANGSLISTHAPSGPITSASGNLSLATQGYGAQITSISQLSKVSPYDQTGNTIGILSTNVNTILTSTSPITAGTASIQLQAKPSNTTPAAVDYADILTLIAAAAF
jgi:hypothetical protein